MWAMWERGGTEIQWARKPEGETKIELGKATVRLSTTDSEQLSD